MKSDDERIEDLLTRKSFGELTDEERTFVLSALGSEEAYADLRTVEKHLVLDGHQAPPVPNQGILPMLQAELRGRHRRAWGASLFQVKVPAYAAALVVVGAVFLSAWLLEKNPQSPLSVPVLTKVDTVYVMRVDTVFRERTVLKTVLATSVQPCVEKKKPNGGEQGAAPKGVSMKDNEELDKLLVSGSER